MPFIKTLTILTCLLLLNACSVLSPYSSLTKLDLTLSGSDTLNPDLHGRPSPIVVRLLELKHPVSFENADFFSLYERPEAVLGSDLVSSEELELSPGKRIDLKLRVKDDSRYVAVLAAYRDLPETRWRYVLALEPERIKRYSLLLDSSGIHLPNPQTPD
ncbi:MULTISPECIES: type VI secretion system lipoprotein TssJ [unclassified Pseudomonas]|uniref:type VI secretion system lipoprotein TssJ n=1 Tax=unclassified Pseudomonas TaxID=196821 RepID=UPI00128B326D|nr:MULTISPECIES: type VI secretion system lipoprotein TssJ [unclassified Pseudomonas]MPQ71086.1 type VI secretion system lipoprotein TssJ [Pseudomonas sp. MWU12-2323]